MAKDIQYVTDIVNGDFDADKIDYLHRDSHFSGIPLMVDLDRLLFSVRADDVGDRKALTVDVRGAVPLEQIAFSKAVLYSTLYHHHKVRASDCTYKAVVERLFEVRGTLCETRLAEPPDLLELNDHSFLNWNVQIRDDIARRLLERLVRRHVPKRALVLSMSTISKDTTPIQLYRLRQQGEGKAQRTAYPELMRVREAIAQEIAKKTGTSVDRYDVCIDLPSNPTLGDAVLKEPDGRHVRLSQVFPVEQWVENYALQRWRGHVFLPESIVEAGAPIAGRILEEAFDLKLLDTAYTLAKLSAPA